MYFERAVHMWPMHGLGVPQRPSQQVVSCEWGTARLFAVVTAIQRFAPTGLCLYSPLGCRVLLVHALATAPHCKAQDSLRVWRCACSQHGRTYTYVLTAVSHGADPAAREQTTTPCPGSVAVSAAVYGRCCLFVLERAGGGGGYVRLSVVGYTCILQGPRLTCGHAATNSV